MKNHLHLLTAMTFILAGIPVLETAQATDIVWTNTAGGTWDTAANWRPAQVPGAKDTAWITNSGTYAVTVSVNSDVANLVLGGSGSTNGVYLPASVLATLPARFYRLYKL